MKFFVSLITHSQLVYCSMYKNNFPNILNNTYLVEKLFECKMPKGKTSLFKISHL